MNIRKAVIATVFVSLMLAGSTLAQTVEVSRVTPAGQVMSAKRHMLAVKYKDNDGTSVNITGTNINPQVNGKAEVKRNEGRTRVRLEIENLGNPQALGPYYTTYILWAIAPEGQADNLAELPIKNKFDVEVTTAFQTFGLIITAEPHSAVKLPSPIIVAENTLRKGTEGVIEASRIEYSGDPGTLYVVSSQGAPSPAADYNTPLLVLGARNAILIARRAGALEYAEPEIREAEVKLAALEQVWPQQRKTEKFSGLAHDVMRLGERARAVAVERADQARLNAERREASLTIAEARSETDRARSETEQARGEAERAKQQTQAYREALARAESEVTIARERVERAQTEADKAKANEELARVEAERARLAAEQAVRDKEALQQRLFISLSEILETRREARGLIVSLSDVLFDFNQATLKPGAREKLSKLAGILLAYPGNFHIEIEGHTDAVGSQGYNQKLSEDRAASVRNYLVEGGLASERIVAVRGVGEIRPVATNDTAEGRQRNRRVEIVISDVDKR
jgi:outer membrane protein OmpA-like peptidoglycan-associated protein